MPESLASAAASPLDVVPAGLLEPPGTHERGRVCKEDAAEVLDAHLRRLGVLEARCRRILGRLAGRFLAIQGQSELGFARLADFSRERLGFGARELQAAAQIEAKLTELPRIAEAFERGALGWSHVRSLVTIARSETEEHWIARACGLTVRALDALIKRERGRGAPGVAAVSEELDCENGLIDGEPRSTLRIPVPRRVARSWKEVVALARKVQGEECPVWKCADAIGAEAVSALDPDTLARAADPSWIPVRTYGDPEPASAREAFPWLDWSAVIEALPPGIDALASGVDDLDAFALDRRMRECVRVMSRIDWQMGRLLRTFFNYRLHHLMGFRSESRYLRERVGISRRKASSLTRLDRRGWDVPELAQAYRSGELSWARATTLLRIADIDNGKAWVEHANQVTVRRLVDEIEWALDQPMLHSVPPPPEGTSLPERQTCARPATPPDDRLTEEIVLSAPASVAEVFRTVIRAYGHGWYGLEKMLAHVKAEWEAQPKHRDPIFARDGWRCAVPGCTSRRNLQVHHVQFRSRGGGNQQWNRVCLCSWHHLRGIHAGKVRAEGRAPDDVLWELGVRPGFPPLMRLYGERYVNAA
jgi:hypothetical protein